MNPKVIDNDKGEIGVSLDGCELRGWSYASDGERREKMVQAHEYAEGWFQCAERLTKLLEAKDAEIAALQAEIVKWKREAGKFTSGCEQCEPKDAEIERLKIVKTAALKIADERGKENDELRAEIAREREQCAKDRPVIVHCIGLLVQHATDCDDVEAIDAAWEIWDCLGQPTAATLLPHK